MKSVICFVIAFMNVAVYAQEYFNILPQSDGLSNQSRLFDTFLDSNYIYVIGDVMDTTIDPLIPQVRAWYSIYNYKGDQILRKIIYDEGIKGLMEASGSRIMRKSNGDFLYNTLLLPKDVFKSLIIEMDDQTGEILNYLILQNPIDTSRYILPGWVANSKFYPATHLYVNQIDVDNIDRIYVLRIDTLLNVHSEFVIEDNGRNNFAYYLEEESDSTFILIGESLKRNDSHPIPEVKLFRMKVNELGDILDFKLQSLNSYSIVFSPSDSYNVFKDMYGNIILNAQVIIPNGMSQDGFYVLPYSISYDTNFDSINWAVSLSEDNDDINQSYFIYGTEYDSTRGTFTIIGAKTNQEFRDSFISKLSINGDSMWTRHFIPLNWDPEGVGWILLRDIKTSPYGSYVSVGHASQLQPGLWRSWMIHIDSFGCFIPGCQNIVATKEIENNVEELIFMAYPNPCSDFLGMLSMVDFPEELYISLSDLNGVTLIQEKIQPVQGYQYILGTSHLMPGLYTLRIYNRQGITLQVNNLYKN